MENKNLHCPLMDGNIISFEDCVENCTIVEGYLKPDSLPKKVKEKKNFREICLACKYHDLD